MKKEKDMQILKKIRRRSKKGQMGEQQEGKVTLQTLS